VFGVDLLHIELRINLQGLVCGYFITSPVVTVSTVNTPVQCECVFDMITRWSFTLIAGDFLIQRRFCAELVEIKSRILSQIV
jgi:hypothetical protein